MNVISASVCAQVGPYDHTVRKPIKGSVLAYWKAEEGLKAGHTMSQAFSQDEQVPKVVSKERCHPSRRVDISGGHPQESTDMLEANAEADEPCVAAEVRQTAPTCVAVLHSMSWPPCSLRICHTLLSHHFLNCLSCAAQHQIR